MMGVAGMALAWASTAISPEAGELVWDLPGERSCDARNHLAVGLLDGRLQLGEVRVAGQCDTTSALLLDVMPTFRAFQEAIETHKDDPEALVVLASGVSTLRSGLVGDAVRLALQLEVVEALEGHGTGPWLTSLEAVAAAEPGPSPGEDSAVFRRMLVEGVAQGPQGDVPHWGRVTVMSAGYLVLLPFVADWAEEAQRAVDGPNPTNDLRAVQGDWRASWVPEYGIVSVTLDLLEDETELRGRWDGLLSCM